MLVSPKWQMMWLQSQYCSKSIANWPLPSQLAQRVLEDLKTSCCSPNKAVQLEALKCWEIWISHHSPDDWKLNTVCFTAVGSLSIKKLQPLHKDVDISKMRLSLMWALLRKVQDLMQLEGPQYIFEVFLQSCLTWLSFNSVDGCENEISSLIFQLLVGIFKKNETSNDCDNEMFPPLSTDFFHEKKVFHRFVDKFLNIFIHWRVIQDKTIFLRLWKHFLEHCELSCEHIPTPIWHSIFKLVSQICSEKNETVKMRVAFLHCCAISLKSALPSSKFIDFGNLLTTPCEALLKKLVELCRVECDEFCDSEMFFHSKEICEVLLNKSLAFGGLDLCISVLDVLEEFYLRSLFWGVWCGLVHCYKVELFGLDKNNFTRNQLKFFRKLRGIAINFELDRNKLYKDCIAEVEKHIDVLNICCVCALRPISELENIQVTAESGIEVNALGAVRVETENQFSQDLTLDCSSKGVEESSLARYCGKFPAVTPWSKSNLLPWKTVIVKFDIIKETLKNIGINSTKPLFSCLFSFRFINFQTIRYDSLNSYFDSGDFSLHFEVISNKKKEINKSEYCMESKASSLVPECALDQNSAVLIFRTGKKKKIDEKVVSVRNTRSKKRADNESKIEMKRKKRVSFEVLVQEIVKKNKERKTEKNTTRRKNKIILKDKQSKKKIKEPSKKENQTKKNKKEEKFAEVFKQKLEKSKKEKSISYDKEKKLCKTDGKRQNYLKIIRKSETDVKKEEKLKKKQKPKKNPREMNFCNSVMKEGKKKNKTGQKQTSLKTMNEKSKSDKVRQGLPIRHKATDIAEKKQKLKKDKKKVTEKPLVKLSSFKEVFHDHEYAKLEPKKLQNFGNILLAKKKKKKKKKKIVEVVLLKREKKFEQEVVKKSKKPRLLNLKLKKSKTSVSDSKDCEFQKLEKHLPNRDDLSEVATEICKLSKPQTLGFVSFGESTHSAAETKTFEIGKKRNFLEEERKKKTATLGKELLSTLNDENNVKKFKMELSQNEEKWNCRPRIDNSRFQGGSGEFSDNEQTPIRRGRKRVRMLDDLKPCKKMKVVDDFQEEKLPLEVTEKENLEEKQELISPIKKEKTEISPMKNDGSPKTINERISSRALKMIALVPESTKGGQMQWEMSPRVEILKCKKAPNVDKNSRASKMLALLSENAVEPKEMNEAKMEEINSNKGLAATPNMKTPVSSLKCPNSVKKKKFIRFDDAKNETVLYLTDTPPSQILEGKEKCRKPSVIILNLS